jgi:hypothetical protein
VEGNQTPYKCALKWDWVIDPSLPATFSFCVLNMAGKDRKAEVTGLLESLDAGMLRESELGGSPFPCSATRRVRCRNTHVLT